MKIIAIKGENLASLGKFDVRLDEGTLKSAGLFAIVGPTGAGKSTLLDAVCLALYGVTPRSNDAGSTRVANANGEAWTAGDERQIVRRGTTQAYAEVVFEVPRGAGASETYVARWSVGVNGEGLFKAPKMVVKCGTEVKASGKRAVADFVEATIGMDFDNFCRSVLLAQGAFAAFLKAKGADRSHVLEVLTDPDKIYRRLSIEAAKRGAASAALLRTASAAVEGVTVLDADARAATEEELHRLAGFLESLAVRSNDVARERALWVARDDAEGDLARARAAATGAETVWDALVPARTVVAEHESVQTLVAPGAALREAERAVSVVEAALLAATTALTQADEAVARHAPVVERARAAVQALETEFAAGAGDRAEALRLDTVVALGVDERVLRAEALTALEGRLAAFVADRGVLDARAAKLEARSGAVAAWHLANPSAAVLAARTDAWLQPLGRFIDETRAGDEAEARRVLRAGEHAHALESQRAGVTAHAEAVSGEEAARAAVLGREHDEEVARVQAPAGRVAEAARQLDQLRQLVQRRVEAEDVRKRRHDEAEKQAEALRASHAAEAAARAYGEALHTLASELATAKEGELLARMQAGTAEMRAALVDGEPCQVCGSLVHPWAAPGALVAPHEATSRRQAAEIAWTETSNAHLLATTQAAAAVARADAAQATIAHLDAQLAGWASAWTNSVATIVDAGDLPMFDDGDRLAVHLASADQALVAASAAETTLEQARVAAIGARSRRDRSVVEAQAALARRTASEASVAAAEAALTQEEQAVAGHRARRDGAWLEAEPVLAGIAGAETLFRTQPEQARRVWTALVAGVGEQAAEQARIDVDVRDLTTARASHDAAHAETQARLEPARSSLADQDARLEAARAERARLLGGRSVAEVEQTYATTHAVLVSAVDAEATALAGAREAAAGRARDVVHHTASRTEAHVRLVERQGAYASALVATGLDEAECARRLTHDPELVLAHRRAIQTASEARVAAAGQVAAAAAQHAEATAALPARTRDALEAEAIAVEDARDVTNRAVGANRQRLDTDDAQRALRLEREAELRALEAEHGVWGRLAHLIGHHEGNTFAVFAQSLSFDSLLQATNQEIRRVRPRYELTSLPSETANAALEMAIRDTEFGGEARPLSTLSGGETFLVSLSMALGLSALTAKSRALGTLFIDEGFGTLDPETLGIAVDALRTLRERGTQVGIISHVGDLAELTPARVRVVKVSEGLSKVETE